MKFDLPIRMAQIFVKYVGTTKIFTENQNSYNRMHYIGYLKLDDINSVFHEMLVISPL